MISPGPLGEWAQGTWPGCHEGTPANIYHLLAQPSTVRLLAVPAHHPGLGDKPTRGLGSYWHMSISTSEKVSLSQALGNKPVNQEALHRREHPPFPTHPDQNSQGKDPRTSRVQQPRAGPQDAVLSFLRWLVCWLSADVQQPGDGTQVPKEASAKPLPLLPSPLGDFSCVSCAMEVSCRAPGQWVRTSHVLQPAMAPPGGG